MDKTIYSEGHKSLVGKLIQARKKKGLRQEDVAKLLGRTQYTLEEYQAKKEAYINEKKKFQESVRDFAAGSNSWFEPAREFVTLLNRAEYAVKEGNLESQKEFLEKIGSNFILKERRLNFPTEGTFRLFFKDAPFLNWRTQSEPIRTAAELKVKIALPPLLNVALYHKIREKVVALHTLGMSLAAIAKSLKINEKTARKAFYYKRGNNELAI